MPFLFRSDSLITTHLEFTVQTVTPLELDEYSGAALRGNFFDAIWERFCTNKSAPTCAACPLHDTCPVSALVAPLREESPQGQDIPRPYVIVPPREGARYYHVGEQFSFGMTLIGSIVQLLPYILLSIKQLEMEGIGRRLDENRGQRGRFRVERVDGFGWMQRDQPVTTTLQAQWPTSRAFACEYWETDLAFLARTVLSAAETTRLEQVMSRALPQCDDVQGKLAHGDFDTTHIYQYHGCYTGIIDFGEIRGANQWYDLGHFHLRDGETLPGRTLPALVQGYGERFSLPSDYEQSLRLMSILINVCPNDGGKSRVYDSQL